MKKKRNLDTRDLIVTIIEKNLAMMGTRTHDRVANHLKNEHHCTISDCYTKPKILKTVLKKQLGRKLNTFIELVIMDLGQINCNKEIERFLEILKS